MHDLITGNGGKKMSVGFSNLEHWYLSTLWKCQLSKVAKLEMVFPTIWIFSLAHSASKCGT